MTVPRQRLHPEGPELSRLVWGAWRSTRSPETDTPHKLARLIDACLELGITSFDHADIYGGYTAEAAFGTALREWRGDRGRIELVSKCGIAFPNPARPPYRVKHYDTGARHIAASVETSLRELKTDYLDLLLIHRPDPLMDADETAGALMRLVEAGKVRHLGVSNHLPSQLELLQSRLPVPLVTNQIELSLLHPGPLVDGTLDQAQRLRASPMLWSPLGGGTILTASTPEGRRVGEALARVAAELGGVDTGALALAWLLAHPSRPVPVLGSSRIERLRSLAAATAIELDRQSWFTLYQASLGHEVA